MIKFVNILISLIFIIVFLAKKECDEKNIILMIIFSIFISLLENSNLYSISLILYIFFYFLIKKVLNIQDIFNITFFKVVDCLIFESLITIIMFISNLYYHDIMSNLFLIILINILSKSIEFLLLNKYSEYLVKLPHVKINPNYFLTIIFNICIIISFQIIDINLLSYNKENFSITILIHIMIIIIYVFSISYIYQTSINNQIKEKLKLYDFQYSYLEEINNIQQKYLKQNHDLKALLYKYMEYDDVKSYLNNLEIFQMINTGNHTLDIVCNYYLNKQNCQTIINLQKKIFIDDNILMKLMDIIFATYINNKIEVYCDDMFVIRISGDDLKPSKELLNFLSLYEFKLVISDSFISILKINHPR